ncbi:MAG: M14 family metallopeptidase [Draconibacterium sp.]
MARIITSLVLVFFTLIAFPQEKLAYFLPTDVNYDSKITTPEQFFKMQMGEWHLTHDQVLNYINEIDRISDRAILIEYARSWENRPLVYLVFSSPENQQKLDELKQLHFNFSEPGSTLKAEDVPLVVNLGYGVHGNESSATNSAVLTAYYLAAAQGEKIDKLLNNTIILVDPCLNPDGFTRHSTWANMHQSSTVMTKTDSRQYREVWPGGRTNHYWFDLNRDYLLLVHPESRGRVKNFHEWKPNIVTDHHEMDANSTFFFQPGVKSRNNPLTPAKNYELTHEIAQFHAAYLDKVGAPYFTEEQFDDYYFGKGSSYPDINGSIGILFEQAGFRGRIRETVNGVRKLAYGIRNQFTVTLSTFDAAVEMKNELLSFQRSFYADALELAKKEVSTAYIFGSETDKIKTQEFVKLMNQHQIEVFENSKEIRADGKVFKPGNSYVVQVKQKQYRLIKSIFEVNTTFADSTFYDVSTWTLPYAFGIPFAKIEANPAGEKAQAIKVVGKITGGKSNLGYVFRWNEYTAPQALFELQNAGLVTKVATEPFSLTIDGKKEQFTYGSVWVQVAAPLAADQVFRLVSQVAEKTSVDFYAAATGLTPSGIDLGSNSFVRLQKPEVMMLVGANASSSDAGELWHLFDQKYKIPVCLTESNMLATVQLEKYNVLILPGGTYPELTDETANKVKDWVKNGGVLIAYRGASAWTVKNGLSKIKFKKTIQPDTTRFLNYADRINETNENNISGAIFNAAMDLTHPLCFGYSVKNLPIFKADELVAESLNVKFAGPVNFTGNPYTSGFVSAKNLERIKNAPVVTVEPFGRGKVITYHENMAFRGIWMATNKLFINAVFFGNTIR